MTGLVKEFPEKSKYGHLRHLPCDRTSFNWLAAPFPVNWEGRKLCGPSSLIYILEKTENQQSCCVIEVNLTNNKKLFEHVLCSCTQCERGQLLLNSPKRSVVDSTVFPQQGRFSTRL